MAPAPLQGVNSTQIIQSLYRALTKAPADLTNTTLNTAVACDAKAAEAHNLINKAMDYNISLQQLTGYINSSLHALSTSPSNFSTREMYIAEKTPLEQETAGLSKEVDEQKRKVHAAIQSLSKQMAELIERLKNNNITQAELATTVKAMLPQQNQLLLATRQLITNQQTAWDKLYSLHQRSGLAATIATGTPTPTVEPPTYR